MSTLKENKKLSRTELKAIIGGGTEAAKCPIYCDYNVFDPALSGCPEGKECVTYLCTSTPVKYSARCVSF